MESETPAMSFEAYIDTQIGFKKESIAAISQSFGLQGKDAEMLYYQMILVGLGLARSCVDGCAPLHLQQVSEILGKNVRAFLMVIRAGADERESFIPQKGVGPDGDVNSYLLMHALAGQNHLLQELHANGLKWNVCSETVSRSHQNPFERNIPISHGAMSASSCFPNCISALPSKRFCWASRLHRSLKPASDLRQNG